MKRIVFSTLAAGLFLGVLCAEDNEGPIRSFGLEFTVISNAVISTNSTYNSIRVIQVGGPDCDDYGGSSNDVYAPFGISVHLGQAQSGVYVSPSDAECRIDGRSMWAHAYGQVNGVTNQLISTITGTRVSWGNYEIEVDLTPLGATSYTYQVWSDGIKTLHATNQCGRPSIYTLNIEDYEPRVNPVFLDAGSPGVIIEFPNGTQFLAGESQGVGDRMMILAEGATNTVDHASSVEIFGSANLPAFDLIDARIGMFGRPHKALGGVNWNATNGWLIAGPFHDTSDGILVDFKNGAHHWAAQTKPFALDAPDASLHLSTVAQASYQGLFHRYLGPVGFVKTNGLLNLHGEFSDALTSNAVLRVFLSNSLVATIQGPSGSILATLSDTNPLVVGWSVTVSNLSFSLAEPTDLTAHDGGMARGDRFVFEPEPSAIQSSHVLTAHVLAQGFPEFTILSESTVEATAPIIKLDIERRANELLLSWPFHRHFFYLGVLSTVTNQPHDVLYPRIQGFRYQVQVPPTNSIEFFSLRHNWYYYIQP